MSNKDRQVNNESEETLRATLFERLRGCLRESPVLVTIPGGGEFPSYAVTVECLYDMLQATGHFPCGQSSDEDCVPSYEGCCLHGGQAPDANETLVGEGDQNENPDVSPADAAYIAFCDEVDKLYQFSDNINLGREEYRRVLEGVTSILSGLNESIRVICLPKLTASPLVNISFRVDMQSNPSL